jgi:hypothetical protein
VIDERIAATFGTKRVAALTPVEYARFSREIQDKNAEMSEWTRQVLREAEDELAVQRKLHDEQRGVLR